MESSGQQKTVTPKKIFRIRAGHIILGLVALGSLVALMSTSVSALTSHNLDSRTLLTQESDASAMTFAQRESFNIILSFHEWSVGEASLRDVQISRAILGQRLAVQTQSGKVTFDLTDGDYREALVALDRMMLGMEDVEVDKRMDYELESTPIIDEFTSQTRHLSQTFEEITRAITAASVEQRVQAEMLQAILIFLGMFSGGSLGLWVTIDIIRGFKAVQNKIHDQRKKLELTRSRLLLVQRVDAKSREFIQEIHSGKPTQLVLADLKHYLLSLAADLWLDIEIADNTLVVFALLQDENSDIGREDHDFMERRLHEVVQAAVARDHQLAQLSVERNFDGLTKLANRNLFTVKVDENMKKAVSGQVTAIMLIDIDRFRDINGSLGYEAGDSLLKVVAERLTQLKGGNEQIARLSGNEFGFTGIYPSRDEAIDRARELVSELNFSVKLSGLESVVSSSMGVAISEPGIEDAGELARCASLAIFLSKEDGKRSGFTVYSSTQHETMMNSLHEEIAVRNALRSGEFVMHFQPIISLDTREPVGVEALIRWQRPGKGLVPPDDFLPIVNRAGLTVELGSEVLRESLLAWERTIAPDFKAKGLAEPYVSINVEALQLQDAGFAGFVLAEAARAHVPNSAIVLEVTEHTLAAGDAVIGQLQKLRQAGIRIALDDFGTGYSNLGQAQKMPLDILKIDKSFLDAVATDYRSHRMVADVTNMAKGQSLKVTAEGIESEQVAELLAGMTVDYGQGYHFSKALPEADLQNWLERQKVNR